MKVLIKDSRGDLISIAIRDNDTFRELNRRMEKEYGLHMDFTNLQSNENIDLDQNILACLTKNSQLIAMTAEEVSEDSVDEANNVNIQILKEEVIEYPEEPVPGCSLAYEEAVEIPEGYELVAFDPELHDQIHQQMEVEYEEAEDVIMITEDAESEQLIDSENYDILQLPQDEMEANTKVIVEITNDVASPFCRLCARSSNEMVYIFGSTESEKDIMEKIDDCLPITVRKTDTFPKKACRSCLEKLIMCHEFHKTVIQAEKKFLIMEGKQLLKSKKIEKIHHTCPLCKQGKTNGSAIPREVDIGHDEQESAELFSGVFTESKETDADDPKNQIPSPVDNQNITTSVKSEIKKDASLKRRTRQSVSTDNQIPNAFSKVGRSVNTSIENAKSAETLSPRISESSKGLTNVGKKATNPEIDEKPVKKLMIAKELRSNTKIQTTLRDANDKLNDQDEDQNKDSTNDCIIVDANNENFNDESSNKKTIKCRICSKAFRTAKKCHIHSSIHAAKGYYPCSLCDRIFITEEECNEHSTEHTQGKKCERRSATHACEECGKKFVTAGRLQFHIGYHKPEARHCYCDKCDKFMVSESALYQHMVTVHQQYKEFCCDICGKQFRAQAQLDTHQRKHKDERPFECTICKKRFYSNEILRRHKKLHLPDKPYQCDQCGKRFDRNNTLTKHLLRHQVEAGRSMMCYICTACNEVFVDPTSATVHFASCKLAEEGSGHTVEERNLYAMYRCEYCEKCYTEVKFMKCHKVCHSGPQPYVCTICDLIYATYNQVTAHKSAHKKSSREVNVKDTVVIPNYFSCEYCDKWFLHFTNMNIHRRGCSKGKNWTCGYCGTIFDNAKQLSKHKKGEDCDEKWPCEECHMSFGSVCALEIHKETHTEEFSGRKVFSCLYCGKIFNQKAHLTIHIRSHTGERPYPCDLCEKAYKIKAERDNHRRTHTGERPYKCTICEKAFTNPARLREHTRFHSGMRPYKCYVCQQAFKKANARNVHMTIHTGEKPFQCDVCAVNFRRRGDMRKHKRTQHGIKDTSQKTNDSLKAC